MSISEILFVLDINGDQLQSFSLVKVFNCDNKPVMDINYYQSEFLKLVMVFVCDR